MASKRGGARKGAGRKSKLVEEDQSAFMSRCLPVEKREAIVNKFYEIAMGDNAKAAVTAGSILLAYAMGKPTEKHELAGKDGGPITLKVVYAE